jgi:hypothetical protein
LIFLTTDHTLLRPFDKPLDVLGALSLSKWLRLRRAGGLTQSFRLGRWKFGVQRWAFDAKRRGLIVVMLVVCALFALFALKKLPMPVRAFIAFGDIARALTILLLMRKNPLRSR